MADVDKPFEFLWSNKMMSDYDLSIKTSEQEVVEASAPSPRPAKRRRLLGLFRSSQDEEDAVKPVEAMSVHGAVLTAASTKFKSMIQGLENNSEDKRTLKIIEKAADHKAFLEMIRFCYFWELQGDLDQQLLAKLLWLSHKYGVDKCLKACADRFASLSTAELNWEAVGLLFELPQEVQESKAPAEVMKKAYEKLFTAFRTPDISWNSKELQEAFLKLPFKALELLLESSKLRVLSENTVVVAAASWMAYNSSRRVHKRRIYELLRLQHTSHTFLGDVLPHLKMFDSLLTVSDCLAVAQYRAADHKVREQLHRAHPDSSAFLPPRATHTGRIIIFNISIKDEEVRAMQCSVAQMLAQQSPGRVISSDDDTQEVQEVHTSAHSGSTRYASPAKPAPQRSSGDVWCRSFFSNGFSCKLSVQVHSSMHPSEEPDTRLLVVLEAAVCIGTAVLAVPSAKLDLKVELVTGTGDIMVWDDDSVAEVERKGTGRVLQQDICTLLGEDDVAPAGGAGGLLLSDLMGADGQLALKVEVTAS